jgi:hypothetical protein
MGLVEPHGLTTKGRFIEFDNPSEQLIFHYNPTQDTWEKAARYGDLDVPGFPGTNPEYQSTGPKRWRFTLFLNEWAQAFAVQRSVEQSIKWLEDRLEPKAQTTDPTSFEEQPPVLLMVLGAQTDKVVLEQISVRNIARRPEVERGRLDVQTQRSRVTRQGSYDTLGTVWERTFNVDNIGVQFIYPKAGQSIRAEVDVVVRKIVEIQGTVISPTG